MKLHLPKVLFTAVVAAVCCVQQAMAADYSVYTSTAITNPETSEVITPAYGYNIIQWRGYKSSNLTGLCYGEYHTVTWDSNENAFADGGVYANSTQTPGTNTNSNTSAYQQVLGTTNTYQNNWNTILLDGTNSAESNEIYYDINPVRISGLIVTKDCKSSTLKANSSGRVTTIGKAGGATAYTTIDKNFTLDLNGSSLTLAGTQVWNISNGATYTIKNTGAFTNTGSLTVNGTLNLSNALTNSGTVQTSGAGKIVVEDYVTFKGTKTYSYSDTATGNGYATATITVIDGGSIGKDGSSVAVEVNGQSYTTINGKVTHTDNSNYWVNTSEVTAGTGEGEIDAAGYRINGGKLNLNSGNWTSAKVMAGENAAAGSINLGTNATFTGSVNNAVDAGVMQYITGTGTMEVTVDNTWGNVIKAHSGFTGTTYVKAGATTNQGQPIGKFTYNAADTVIGSILKMGEGVHMQVNNTVNNTEADKDGYTPDAIDATLAADKQMILEAGSHDVYVNGHVIFDVYGTISGEGTFNKHAGGVINFKNGSNVANLESSSSTNSSGITNIEAGASVTNFAVKGSTSNIHGGANVENVSVAGGTLNLGVDAGAELSVSSLSYTSGTVNNKVATTVDNLAVTAGKTFTVGGTGVLTATTLELENGAKLTSSTGSITLGTLSIDLAAYTTDYTNTHTLVSVTGENQNLTVTGSLDHMQGVSVADGAYVADVQLQDNSLVLTYYSTLLTTTVSDVSGFDAEKNILTLCVSGDINNFHSTALVTGFDGDALDKIFTEAGLTAGQMVGITLIDAEGDELPASADKLVGFQGPDGVYQGELVGSQWQYNVSYIPEPATATLSLLALAGLAARRRRK